MADMRRSALIFRMLSDMVGLSIRCGSLKDAAKTLSARNSEMIPTIYNCIKNSRHGTRDQDPRTVGTQRPNLSAKPMALFCGVME